jgi:hypothetical protein
MIIDGKEIEFFIKRAKVPEKYYGVLVREVRLALNSLNFISDIRTKRSVATDSIYFTVKLKNISEVYTLSIRSHFPKEVKENYLYFYTPRFNSLSELHYSIKFELSKLYNMKAKECGLHLVEYPSKDVYKKTIIKKKSKKEPDIKLKGTRAHFKKIQQDSFEDFINEFRQSENK